jgi:thymidine kinase
LASSGQLQLIIGPMFSGKSTKLLHAATSYRAIGKQVLIINHTINVRYSRTGITTHDYQLQCTHRSSSATGNCTLAEPIPMQNSQTSESHKPERSIPKEDLRILTISDLCELQSNAMYRQFVEAADIICIEELQFFPSTVEVVSWLVDDLEKHVVCAGLIGDYTRAPFGDILQLIPRADELVHLKALCTMCNDGTPGVFTQRLSTEQGQVHVGESNAYRAVCRRHYLQCPVRRATRCTPSVLPRLPEEPQSTPPPPEPSTL